MENIKLSIIIVSWNTRDLLKQTLKSVYRETGKFNYEVIVIDNNSTKDDSVAMVKEFFPRVILIENKDNLGFSKANNQGMKVAKGEFMMLLNSDVIVQDRALEKLVYFLEKNPDAKMIGPKLLNADLTFQHACRRNLPDPLNSFFHLFGVAKIFKNSKKINAYKRGADDENIEGLTEGLSGAAMMFRREVYEKIGGLDEDFFMYGEDLDFCKRVLDNVGKIYYVPESQIIHLYGSSSKKRRVGSLINFHEAMWLYYKKHFYKKANFLFNFMIWFGIKFKLYLKIAINSFK